MWIFLSSYIMDVISSPSCTGGEPEGCTFESPKFFAFINDRSAKNLNSTSVLFADCFRTHYEIFC
jgi:hypothetical protein